MKPVLRSRLLIATQFSRAEVDEPLALRFLHVLERLAAAVFFLAALPLLAVAASVIFVLSGRPPLVTDDRIGRYGAPLRMLKLRTMWPRGGYRPRRFGWTESISAGGQRTLKRPDDDRISSRIALFCRRHSIDEIPQLWHVMEGRMSLVGPRPLTLEELEEHYGEEAAEVLSVPPGLTGLWQVMGRGRLSYAQRKKLDLRLVKRYSPGLFLSILRRTVKAVIHGNSAW